MNKYAALLSIVVALPIHAAQTKPPIGSHAALLSSVFVLPALVTQSPPRPVSLNIQTDCGATPDDGTDDTIAIRDCIAQEPYELVIPVGVFDVDRIASNQPALSVKTSDTVIRGDGPGSTLRLIRPASGFSSARLLEIAADVADTQRVTVRDLTLDGGMGAFTCQDVKHTPGVPPDGKGQQAHGLVMRGQIATVSDVVVSGVNFVGISGDAINLYQDVEDVRIQGQTITGYCRGGIVANGSTDCRTDKTRGMRRIVVDGNTIFAGSTASQGARAIDIEPNGVAVCDMRVTNNVVDEMQFGGVDGLTVEGNTLDDIKEQTGGPLATVSVYNFTLRNNLIRSKDVVTPGIYVRKSHIGVIATNTVEQSFPSTEALFAGHNGAFPSTDITITDNRLSYVGAGAAPKYALKTSGVVGALTITGNRILGAWDYGINVWGADDALVAGNIWDVGKTALVVRSDPGGILETNVVTVEANRGTAAKVYAVSGTIDALRDCTNTSTGARSLGGNALLSCSPAEDATREAIEATDQKVLSLEERITALETQSP